MELRDTDPQVAQAIEAELEREQNTLELIAAENLASPAVLAAQGSVLTNKYAEGYPGKRYYGGCEFVDVVEELAISRAKQLFGAEHANVQPHSGAQANMAVYLATLEPGDSILGLDLAHGGHLTHGTKVNFSGTVYRSVAYGVDRETELLDYDEILRRAKQERPAVIVAGASAYPRTINFSEFKSIADEVGAVLLVDMAHIAGLVAAGLHPSPVPHAEFVSTTTHKTLRGPRGGMVLCRSESGPELDRAVFPGMQGGPLMHVIAAKAVALREALSQGFNDYQSQVLRNASALADRLSEDGLRLVSGGTDNHLILVDLSPRDITGAQAESILDECGITVNKNTIPFDTRGPQVTSGIRIGSPAVTTRGMREAEMRLIADMITEALSRPGDQELCRRIRGEVKALCDGFPIYSRVTVDC